MKKNKRFVLIKCPKCKEFIDFYLAPGEKISITCPECKTKGYYKYPETEEKVDTHRTPIIKEKTKKISVKNLEIEKKDTKIQRKGYSVKHPSIRSKIVGIPLIIIGLVFLIDPNAFNLRISFTLILIGYFMVFIINEKDKLEKKSKSENKFIINYFKKNKLLVSEKITIIIAIWIILLFFIIEEAALDTFFVLIFIGILVIKELTDEFISKYQKKTINILIFIFLIIYIITITQRILPVLTS